VGIGYSPLADLAIGDVFSGNVACTITSANGAIASCTSGATDAVDTSTFISMTLTNIANPADFENSRLLTTFTCH
jgi:hypothetical protein